MSRLSHCASLLVLLAVFGLGSSADAQTPPRTGMTIASPAFADGGILPDKFTQASANPVSPALAWSNAPADTITFALLMHDPEGPSKKQAEDVTHWMIFNIPGSTHLLPEAVAATPQLPDGAVQIKNVRGSVGFTGPGAPATGPYHHYTFELYALDTKLGVGPDASRDDVFKAMDGHVIGKAVVIARFHRPS